MTDNPLDQMSIKRAHIIALHEAYTHTNKQKSTKRANNLLELLEILKTFDKKRTNLIWDDDNN